MPLDYSPRESVRWYHGKRFHRALWAAMILCLAPLAVALLVVAADAAVAAWRAARNRALLRDCMTYLPPPDQVVFEMGAGTAARVVAAPWLRWWPPGQLYPTLFLHERRDAKPTGFVPPDQLYPTLFLHERRDAKPTGFVPPDQLVVVQLETQLRGTYDGRTVLDRPLLCFECYQINPNPGAAPGSVSHVFGSTTLVVLPSPTDRIRIFAGQPDATGPAAFALDVEYNGVRQPVRSRLSGGVVTLEPGAGTTLAPPGWRHATFWIPAGATDTQATVTDDTASSAGQPSPTTWPMMTFGKAVIPPTGT